MTTLSSPGISSGLDVNGIVTQLMTLEQQPLKLLQKQQSSYNTQISSIGQIQSMMAGFQTAAEGLSSASANPVFKATSADSSVFSATASATAVAGSYAIGVSQLAQSQKIVASGVTDMAASIGAGTATTLTIDFGTISGGAYDSGSGTYSGASFDVNADKTQIVVDIDDSNNTLPGIRDAINSKNAGVSATIVNDGSGTPYRLVLTSTDTGAASSLRIGVAGDATLQTLLAYDPAGTQNLSQHQVAQDAGLSVDGIAITSASNSVSDAIEGVTLNLLELNTPSTTQLTVSHDSSALTNALNALVSAYNNVDKVIASATAQGATMQGDSTILAIQRQLRNALSAMQSNSGVYSSLADINVTLQKDGTLAIDSTKLQARIDSNLSDVTAVISAFGTSLGAISDLISDSSTGELANETAGINAAIKDNANQQDAFSRRLTTTEATLRAQFSALDALMVKMNQTSNFLQQQFYKTTTTNSSGG
ncbi:MAG: flagellar filament capping protein FliD [Georgfuchsia sp.]